MVPKHKRPSRAANAKVSQQEEYLIQNGSNAYLCDPVSSRLHELAEDDISDAGTDDDDDDDDEEEEEEGCDVNKHSQC